MVAHKKSSTALTTASPLASAACVPGDDKAAFLREIWGTTTDDALPELVPSEIIGQSPITEVLKHNTYSVAELVDVLPALYTTLLGRKF